MDETINIFDARNNLSKLVSAAQRGTDTVIARRGRPVARITHIDVVPEHTAAGVAGWLAAHPLPSSAARTLGELDAQIQVEREDWE
jgi:prevent-host-death family protein